MPQLGSGARSDGLGHFDDGVGSIGESRFVEALTGAGAPLVSGDGDDERAVVGSMRGVDLADPDERSGVVGLGRC